MSTFGVKPDELMTRRDADIREIIFANRKRVELEAQRNILAEARKSGVNLDPRTGMNDRGVEFFVGLEKLFEISQQAAERGGRVLPGPNESAMNRLADAVEENTRALRGEGTSTGLNGAPPAVRGALIGTLPNRRTTPPPAFPGKPAPAPRNAP
jgi:hypothetical protein